MSSGGLGAPFVLGSGRTIGRARHLAAQIGGQCLSEVYVNARSKLLWECAKGHRWKATPNNVQRGSWCVVCAGKTRLTIREMHRLAEARGGKCLSDSYVNNRTPLLWECKDGHRWQAGGGNIRAGKWCLICAGLGKPSMGDIQHLAQQRGGKCLSRNYANNRTPLRWECIEGHKWKAVWSSVQMGTWCPECSAGLGERICREFFTQLFQKAFRRLGPSG